MSSSNNLSQNDFQMPAEWAPHQAVWLAWPYDKITFPDRVERVENCYIQMIKILAQSERVKLLVFNENMKKHAGNLLIKNKIDLKNIDFYVRDYADVWIRDYGPSFVKKVSPPTLKLRRAGRGEPSYAKAAEGRQKLAEVSKEDNVGTVGAVKWRYSAYGHKFPDLEKDDLVGEAMKKWLPEVTFFEPEIFMEGGAIEVNGAGTLITTEQCLLNKNRNPDLSKKQIEQILFDYLGVSKIVWLKEGITNDHTDGHIDDFVRFVNERTILCAYEEDTNHPNYLILDQAYNQLLSETDQNGQKFTVIKLPMPHMNYDDGEIAPASYANFYIANKAVLVPTFNDENDSRALQIIQSCFPDRKMVGVDCRDLIYGGGAVHCVTQQMPVGSF